MSCCHQFFVSHAPWIIFACDKLARLVRLPSLDRQVQKLKLVIFQALKTSSWICRFEIQSSWNSSLLKLDQMEMACFQTCFCESSLIRKRMFCFPSRGPLAGTISCSWSHGEIWRTCSRIPAPGRRRGQAVTQAISARVYSTKSFPFERHIPGLMLQIGNTATPWVSYCL